MNEIKNNNNNFETGTMMVEKEKEKDNNNDDNEEEILQNKRHHHKRSASVPNGDASALEQLITSTTTPPTTAAAALSSRIPVPSSPILLRRQSSFKMRRDSRPPTISEWEENKSSENNQINILSSSTSNLNNIKLKRHRSLQGLYSSTPLSNRCSYERDDDQDSVSSMNSNTSSICEHAHFARNGTTYSARKMKYIVHCSSHPESTNDEYLTPTQRSNRSIRRLRTLLAEAQNEIMDKEHEITRLTKELVELRLNKASIKTDQIDNGIKKENNLDCQNIQNQNNSSGTLEDVSSINGAVSPQLGELTLSLADSGHFEDLGCGTHSLERELERMKRTHDDMREKYNDKVESLLKRITETNDKFYEIKPQYDSATLRIKQLENENEELKKNIKEKEEMHKSMVQIYSKEKEAATAALNAKAAIQLVKTNQANQTEKDIVPVHINSNNIESTPKKPIQDENLPKILQELEISRKELEEIKVHLKNPMSNASATLPLPTTTTTTTNSTASKKRVKSKLKSFRWKTLSTMFRNPSSQAHIEK